MKYLIFASVLLGLIACFALILLLLMKPNKRRTDMEALKNTYIAHRGLHNGNDIPENSIAAFENAISHGYGIELDVQLTKDNKLVVFHDGNIKRVCNANKKVNSLTYEALCNYKLLDTDYTVPLMKDVLDLVDGKVPLLIEIKSHGNFINTCKTLAKMLDDYKGSYAIQSFNPAVVRWFKQNRPKTIRGILASDYLRVKNKTLTQKLLVSNLLFNAYCKPDFISYNHEYSKKAALRICRSLFKCNTACWTIRSSEALENMRSEFDVFIFELFNP